MTIYVHGFGHFHPENEITNKFLEELDIDTSEEWIMERVGIRSRRTILPLDYIRETKNRSIAKIARNLRYIELVVSGIKYYLTFGVRITGFVNIKEVNLHPES